MSSIMFNPAAAHAFSMPLVSRLSCIPHWEEDCEFHEDSCRCPGCDPDLQRDRLRDA